MDTTTTQKLFTVSERAKEQVHRLLKEKGMDETYGIRVSVMGGGCSGLSYELDYDNAEKPGDTVVEDKGLNIYVNAKSLLYLVGTELDFTDGLNGKGFEFINPNASRTCACGESFAV